MKINFVYLCKKLNSILFTLQLLYFDFCPKFLYKINFLNRYYLLNDLIWQEALLVDFLQKKIINNWTQKFLTVSAYLFNERVVFDNIVRFALDFFLWPAHRLFLFEISSVSNLLAIVVFLFFFFFLSTGLFYAVSLLF